MAAQKILIIEDELKIARFLELELGYEGYIVEQSHDGREGLQKILLGSFDLILLDIMLPSMNGIEVLRKVRQTSKVPIIMLTAKDEIMDKVMGLDMGADDYITKPFAIEELLARIRVALRKKASENNDKKAPVLAAGALRLDTESREAWVNSSLLNLTKREFDLLQHLLENKGIVLKREMLLERIWGYDFTGETNAVDVYVSYLRTKVEEPFGLKLIHTIRGVGYVIKDE